MILATSHYGEPEKFGLTRKAFRTPLGDARSDTALVDWLAKRGGGGRGDGGLLPLLRAHGGTAGDFSAAHAGRRREDSAGAGGRGSRTASTRAACRRTTTRCGPSSTPWANCASVRAIKLFWVMGVDMAHMGARYHDRFAATAGQGEMEEVASRDEQRIERINALDAGGFWESGARAAGRSEVVRIVAVLHVPEDGAEGSRRIAAVTSSGTSTRIAW